MADDPTWEGLARGLLILGVLWWAWVGYAWLTSVVDPEEGAVRLAMFGAMAALLVVRAVRARGLRRRRAAVRGAPTASCASGRSCCSSLASRDDPDAALGRCWRAWRAAPRWASGLLVAASFTDGALQGGLWALALALDMAGPLLLRRRGLEARARPLRRAPRADHHHRPGRVDRRHRRRRRRAASTSASSSPPRSSGSAVAAALWWLYFDVVALVAERRLSNAAGRPRAERDRARLVLLPAPADGGGHRAGRARA